MKTKEKIILVDFGGTLIKPEILDEANKMRSAILERGLPTREEHAHSETLYKNNREYVEKLTGITSDMILRYTTNTRQEITITGEELQNQISTNLFQIGMYIVAKKHGLNIYPQGFIEQLERIQKLGYKLAIASGVRTEIISGMLAITQTPIEFDYIFGQPPILGINNEEHVAQLQRRGDIIFIIGDKMSDLEPAKLVHAKTIFVTWGTPTGGEESVADHTITKAEQLERIIL